MNAGHGAMRAAGKYKYGQETPGHNNEAVDAYLDADERLPKRKREEEKKSEEKTSGPCNTRDREASPARQSGQSSKKQKTRTKSGRERKQVIFHFWNWF